MFDVISQAVAQSIYFSLYMNMLFVGDKNSSMHYSVIILEFIILLVFT